jgi:hypothetical protein
VIACFTPAKTPGSPDLPPSIAAASEVGANIIAARRGNKMARKAKAFEDKETPEEEAKEHKVMAETARKAMRGKRGHKRTSRKSTRY